MTRARTTPTVTLDQIRNRATIPVWHATDASAAGVFGVGRATSYAMAERGDFPTLRLGARVVVPVPALLALLGERPVSTGYQDLPPADQDERARSHDVTPTPLTGQRA